MVHVSAPPKTKAAQMALKSICLFENDFERIITCQFSSEDFNTYTRVLENEASS